MRIRYEPWGDDALQIEEDGEERRVQILRQVDPMDCWELGVTLAEYESEWEWFLDFAGISECSNKYQQHIISQVLDQNPVDCIVELGTFKGALALYLGVCGAMHGVPVYTFDRDLSLSDAALPGLNRLGVERVETDYLENKVEVLSRIGFRPCYLICDGDNKKKADEFNAFVPHLRRGSVVSIHDWYSEVKPDDIRETVEAFKMRPFGRRDWLRHHVQFATFVKESG